MGDGGSILCSGAFNPGLGMEDLVFGECAQTHNGTTSKPSLTSGAACSLTRNFGVRAVFDCKGQSSKLYCTTARAKANEKVAQTELAYGTDIKACWKDFDTKPASLKQAGMR